MIAETISFLLRNLPAVLFVVALAVATICRGHDSTAERFLSWMLLLPIGLTGIWAGTFHVFFPTLAAKLIGWEVSPFQFEVGMADLAIGVTACLAFGGASNLRRRRFALRRSFYSATQSDTFTRWWRREISRRETRACHSS